MICLTFEMLSQYGMEMDCEWGTDKSGRKKTAREVIVIIEHEVLVSDPSVATW